MCHQRLVDLSPPIPALKGEWVRGKPGVAGDCWLVLLDDADPRSVRDKHFLPCLQVLNERGAVGWITDAVRLHGRSGCERLRAG